MPEKQTFWEKNLIQSTHERQNTTLTDKAWKYYLRSTLSNEAEQKLRLQLQEDIQALEDPNLSLEDKFAILKENKDLRRLSEKPNKNTTDNFEEYRKKVIDEKIGIRKLVANKYREMLGQKPNFAFYADYVIAELSDIYKDATTLEMIYQSIPILEEALERYPNVWEFHEKLAEKYTELGDYAKAARVATKLVDLFKNGSQVCTIDKKLEPDPIERTGGDFTYIKYYEDALIKEAYAVYLTRDFKKTLENINQLESDYDNDPDPDKAHKRHNKEFYQPLKAKALFQVGNYQELLNILKKKITETVFVQTDDRVDFEFGSDKDAAEFWHNDLIETSKAKLNLFADELYFNILLQKDFKKNYDLFQAVLSELRLLEKSSKDRFQKYQEINQIKLKLAFCALKTGNFVVANEIYTEIDPQKKLFPDFMSSSSAKNESSNDEEKSVSIALLISSGSIPRRLRRSFPYASLKLV